MYFAILFYNFFHMTKMLQNLINKKYVIFFRIVLEFMNNYDIIKITVAEIKKYLIGGIL